MVHQLDAASGKPDLVPPLLPGSKRARPSSPCSPRKRPALLSIHLRQQLDGLLANVSDEMLSAGMASCITELLRPNTSSATCNLVSALVSSCENARTLVSAAVPAMTTRERVLLGRELQRRGARCSNVAIPTQLPLPLRTFTEVCSFLSVSELLCKVACVSRGWFIACMDERVWRGLRFFRVGHVLPPLHVLDRLSGVQSLDLTNVSAQIDDAYLQRVMPLMSATLTDLSLEGCSRLSDSAIADAVTRLNQLQKLSLKYCSRVSRMTCSAIARSCTQLRDLNINYVHVIDADIRSIASGCPHLTTLSLKYCRLVTNDALYALAQSCKQLKSVTLSYCDEVDDEGIQALAKECVRLFDIDVKYCRLLGDPAMIALARHCPHLRRVKFNYCKRISDVGVKALVKACHELEQVELVRCADVSDSAIAAIASAKTLRKLCVDGCVKAGNATAEALLARRTPLMHLDLSLCVGISSLSLMLLAEKMSRGFDGMACLRLAHCTQLSKAQQEQMAVMLNLKLV